SKTVKLTKHLTCTFMNSNTKTKSSTLSVHERTVSDSIWLKFQRQPRGHAKRQLQRSCRMGEFRSRLIHNRPGSVGCENAWDRYATSQQHAGPEKGDCG